MQKLKVLIIEDEQLIAEVFKKQLVLLGGFEVCIAKDGHKAFDILNEKICDVILLDLMMTDMDGFEVLEKLKEEDKFKRIPVIILTNVTNPDAKKKALELGAVDYIVKTEIDPKTLIQKISEYASKRN